LIQTGNIGSGEYLDKKEKMGDRFLVSAEKAKDLSLLGRWS